MVIPFPTVPGTRFCDDDVDFVFDGDVSPMPVTYNEADAFWGETQ